MAYRLTRNLDNLAAGTIAPDDWLALQDERGNLPDLISNGLLVEVESEGKRAVNEPPAPTLENMSYKELQRLAKSKGIAANQSRDVLLDVLLDALG